MVSSASKPKQAKKPKRAAPKKLMSVGSTWTKVAGNAPWVGGQSSGLNPGSTQAIGRRRNSPKFKARGKKVIRPRITKHHKQPDKP